MAEFYHTVAALERDVRQAQLRSWAVVGSVMLLAYLLLAGLAAARQRHHSPGRQSVLNAQVAAQQALLAQNAELHERVQREPAPETPARPPAGNLRAHPPGRHRPRHAVAEFYHTVAALERDVRQAQLRSWAVVGSVMLL
ncbi:hypothetical protein CTI14_40595, partial [Methylobacterium radiotolerans]